MANTRTAETKNSILLENIFYLLCGLDTTHIKVGIRDKKYALLADTEYSSLVVLPFESIAVNIRILNKFILRSQYSSGPMRRIMSDIFERKVAAFLKKVVECRRSVGDIETLSIVIRSEILEFEEIRCIIENSREMGGVQILNLLRERKEDAVHLSALYDELLDACMEKVREDLVLWMTRGIISDAEFMVTENRALEGFNDSVWSSRYSIARDNVPYFVAGEEELIYNCGRVINVGKQILCKDAFTEADAIFRDLGTRALNRYLNGQLLDALRSRLQEELDVFFRHVLLNEASFYADAFDELGDEILYKPRSAVLKMNAMRKASDMHGFTFEVSTTSLNEYVLKILNAQTQCNYNRHMSLLQSLTIEYSPALLCTFLSKKLVSEIEILFRFLFTLAGISHFMLEHKGHRFAKLALLFLNNFRSSAHLSMKPIDVKNDVDYVVSALSSSVRKMLRDFSLTTEKTYLLWAKFFDLCFEFIGIEFKDAMSMEEVGTYEQALACLVNGLKDELAAGEYDHALITFLEATDWSRVFLP
jgi:gamma-tubulin complex component 2